MQANQLTSEEVRLIVAESFNIEVDEVIIKGKAINPAYKPLASESIFGYSIETGVVRLTNERLFTNPNIENFKFFIPRILINSNLYYTVYPVPNFSLYRFNLKKSNY